MNKNSLLIVIAILAAGIVAAYWFKTQSPQAVESQQQQNQDWNDWNSGPNQQSQAPIQPPAAQPEVPALPSKPASYENAMQLSKTHKKPVLLFFTADWCSYCQKMKSQTFSDAQVKKAMDNVIYYEVNVDKERAIAQKWGVRSMPTYKIVDGSEKVLAADSGFKPPAQFITWLKGVANPY
jgi:thiol:disulfide interchange protein